MKMVMVNTMMKMVMVNMMMKMVNGNDDDEYEEMRDEDN